MADPTLSKARYIPLAEASKISGYTDEYILRLCRIGKIPCRVMGEKKIVELDSLLRETGTILMGSERVGFIEVDDESKYPLLPMTANVVEEVESDDDGPHTGSIAVVGHTVRSEEETQNVQNAAKREEEKPRSEPLPFFSSYAQEKTTHPSVHLRVAGSTEPQILPPTPRFAPAHIPVASVPDYSAPIRQTHPLKILVSQAEERKSSVKAIKVMPDVSSMPPMPASPAIMPMPQAPTSAPASEVQPPVFQNMFTPSPVAQVEPSPHVSAQSAVTERALSPYVPKLPAIFDPSLFSGKLALAVLAFGLLVAPTSLGFGNFLNNAILKLGGTIGGGTHAMLSAVGFFNADQEAVKNFPSLQEASQLLSAPAAAGQTGNGIVVTPSTGNTDVDQQIKTTIQQSFSDPVNVIPDGSDGRTGIIRPVFQKGGGPSYLYMMVPVRN